MLSFIREVVVTMASSEREKLPRLQYPRNTLENLRKDRVGHVLIKANQNKDVAKYANINLFMYAKNET